MVNVFQNVTFKIIYEFNNFRILQIKTWNQPIITLAGTAFHSSQKVINEEVTKMIPGMKTVVK